MDHTFIKNMFAELFKTTPVLIKSPGRINFIGEHTDYNNGFVLPAAIDKFIYIAIQKNNQRKINIYAYNLQKYVSVDIENIEHNSQNWVNYITGPYVELLNNNCQVSGFDCVFGGEIPLGAGMSSSAAIECGLIYGLKTIFDLNINKLQVAQFAQHAEQNFAGVNCGIMDQFAITHGEKNCVVKLDCENLSYDLYDYGLVDYVPILVNSMVKHNLASSEYNIRRQECERGVEAINAQFGNISSLRDVNMKQIESMSDSLDSVVYNRCLYVVEENLRVNEFCDALLNNDATKAGLLMCDSHLGLKNKYEVSCDELDFLVGEAMNLEYVCGSRMMGGGFGGCTINLVKKGSEQKFIKAISSSYKTAFAILPEIYLVNITNGVEIIN